MNLSPSPTLGWVAGVLVLLFLPGEVEVSAQCVGDVVWDFRVASSTGDFQQQAGVDNDCNSSTLEMNKNSGGDEYQVAFRIPNVPLHSDHVVTRFALPFRDIRPPPRLSWTLLT
jgi:hypothetical protein